MTVKPPLGLRPRYIAELQREVEVVDAIRRYLSVGLPVPIDWIAEYNELAKRREGA